MAVVAAIEVAVKAGPDSVVVVLLPDGGRGYMSKVFNDAWSSPDQGQSWIQRTDLLTDTPRYGQVSLEFQAQEWLIAGFEKYQALNPLDDVWVSP
jgi:hypothetical protein